MSDLKLLDRVKWADAPVGAVLLRTDWEGPANCLIIKLREGYGAAFKGNCAEFNVVAQPDAEFTLLCHPTMDEQQAELFELQARLKFQIETIELFEKVLENEKSKVKTLILLSILMFAFSAFAIITAILSTP